MYYSSGCLLVKFEHFINKLEGFEPKVSKKTVLAQISASIAVNTNNKFTATYNFFRMPLPTHLQIAILFESHWPPYSIFMSSQWCIVDG